MFAKFIREISQTWFPSQVEMGTWVLSKPTAPHGDQSEQWRESYRCIVATTQPYCMQSHLCQRLGKAWNPMILILFSPHHCTCRSPSGPSDPSSLS